jgi:mRNA-degrading endonuclease RelE of RelBE toxin-antitoxin system
VWSKGVKFSLEFHPKADKEAKDLLKNNLEIVGEFKGYLSELSENPNNFLKKKGKLKSCRALSFNVQGKAWRLIFRILEDRGVIEILAIGIHDDAYNSAERRA